MTLLAGPDHVVVDFVAGLAAHGDRPALVTPRETLTYAELAERVARIADQLGPARRLVAVQVANELHGTVGYLAALAGGHVALVMSATDERHQTILDTFDPDAVVTGGTTEPRVTERRPGSAHDLHPDLALLLSTSGSTGSPRLVRLSRQGVEANAHAIATYLGIATSDRAATTLPLHYCYGLSVLHSHLARGASVVLTDLSVVDPCFWDLVRDQGVTALAGVPHTFELLDRIGFEDLDAPTLRYITQAGGRMDPEVVRRYAALGHRAGWDLVVMYGQTEATARMAYLPPEAAATHPWSIGVPIPGGSFDLEPVDDGGDDEGELVYRGPNVMLGYAEAPADLAVGATVEALRTGDIARRHPNGFYEIVGRRSRFAKIAGIRIDLDHAEREMRRRGLPALCASDDRRLVVGLEEAVAPPETVKAIAADVCGLPASRVAPVVLDTPARLPNGKPDHRAVLVAAERVDHEDAAIDPRGERGAPVGVAPAVWLAISGVLGPVAAGPEDTFVSLGGDSLSYVEVSIALEAVLGDLPPDWHARPLGELTSGGSPRRLARVETSVVLRALSIVLIAGSHIGAFHLLGGAHLLLAVGGWNYARFNRTTGDRLRSVARIALPSMAWLTLAALTMTHRIQLDHVFLVHGWFGDRTMHGGYWYIEAIVQILLATAAVLAIPPVARGLRAHPFGVPLALAAAGLAVRFGVVDLPTVEPHDIRSHDIFWLFALGWAGAAASTTRSRVLVTALVLAAVPGYFGEPQREVLVTLGLLVLLWVRTVPLPRLAARSVGQVAAASLAIYLTHWQIFPPVSSRAGELPALAAAVVGGVAIWWLSRSLLRFGQSRWSGLRQSTRSRSAVPPSYAITGGPA